MAGKTLFLGISVGMSEKRFASESVDCLLSQVDIIQPTEGLNQGPRTKSGFVSLR